MSLISLKRSRSISSRATSPSDRLAAARPCVEAVAQQLPVGQAGQRVVRGLVPVALGGGLQRLPLAAQLRRRRRDQAEDDEVEDGQAGDQGDRHRADVLGHRGGDGRVRQVQLDDAVRVLGAVVLQGHVHLEQPVRRRPRCRRRRRRSARSPRRRSRRGRRRARPTATSRRRARGSPSGRRSCGRGRRSSARWDRRRPAPGSAVPNSSAASSTASSTPASRSASKPSRRSAGVNCGWSPRRTAMRAASSACWRARASMAVLSTDESTAPTAIVSTRLTTPKRVSRLVVRSRRRRLMPMHRAAAAPFLSRADSAG